MKFNFNVTKEDFNGFIMSQVIASESGKKRMEMFTEIEKEKIHVYFHISNLMTADIYRVDDFDEAIKFYNNL